LGSVSTGNAIHILCGLPQAHRRTDKKHRAATWLEMGGRMTPEDEEFNRIEMESRIKQEYVRDMKQPSREQLIAEVTVLTELVRVLSDRVAELEKNT
jgi:hypothetical protein